MKAILGSAVVAFAVMGLAETALAQDYYGSIAYSPSTGVYGYSYDYTSQSAAEGRALSECRARGQGCQSVMWFRNACGALAIGPDGWGTSWGVDRGDAENKSIYECQKYSGNCSIQVWVCTTR